MEVYRGLPELIIASSSVHNRKTEVGCDHNFHSLCSLGGSEEADARLPTLLGGRLQVGVSPGKLLHPSIAT